MDNIGKKVGINAGNAKDSGVEPLVPMFGGKIAVHPQYPDLCDRNPYNGGGGGQISAIVEIKSRTVCLPVLQFSSTI
jgi:hypothetical protein